MSNHTPDAISHKTCAKCGETQPVTAFHRNLSAPDGLVNQCKTCRAAYRRQYYAENGQAEREQNRRWKAENSEHVLEYARKKGREYYAKNREKRIAYQRLYYSRNRQHVLWRNGQWATRNRDKVSLIRQRHRVKHIEALRIVWHKYRFRKAGADGGFTVSEWLELCERYHNRCLACGREGDLTRDHIVPLSKGGSNDIGNIQPLCGPCNSAKGTQIIDYRK